MLLRNKGNLGSGINTNMKPENSRGPPDESRAYYRICKHASSNKPARFEVDQTNGCPNRWSTDKQTLSLIHHGDSGWSFDTTEAAELLTSCSGKMKSLATLAQCFVLIMILISESCVFYFFTPLNNMLKTQFCSRAKLAWVSSIDVQTYVQLPLQGVKGKLQKAQRLFYA